MGRTLSHDVIEFREDALLGIVHDVRSFPEDVFAEETRGYPRSREWNGQVRKSRSKRSREHGVL